MGFREGVRGMRLCFSSIFVGQNPKFSKVRDSHFVAQFIVHHLCL